MSTQETPSKEASGQATQIAATGDNQQTTTPTTNPDANNPTEFAEGAESAETAAPVFSRYKNDDEEADAMSGVSFQAFKDRTARVTPDASKKEEAKPVPQSPVAPVATKPKTRVFENLEADEVELFERMSNKAYEKLYPLYLEHKKLKPNHEVAVRELQAAKEQLEQVKGKVPPSLFNHPKGYMLSQKYESLNNDASVAQYIKQHWETQLAKHRKGEKWTNLDIENGKIKLTPDQEPTTESEIAVLQNTQFALQQLTGIQHQLETHVTEFSSSFKRDADFIREAEAKFFPGFEKPDHPTARIQKEILTSLPLSYQEHPLASMLAKTTAHLVLVQQEREAAKKEAEAARGVRRDAQNPTASQFQGGGGKPAPMNGVTFSAFRDRGNRA